jgi:two-component system cell cycle response regulator DivK
MSTSVQVDRLQQVKDQIKMAVAEQKSTGENGKPEEPGRDGPTVQGTPTASPVPPSTPSAAKQASSTPAPQATAPEASAGKPKPDAPAGPAEVGAPPLRKPIDPAQAHVLVVEDNVANFVLIARLLAFMGIQHCEWKTSGWQVVEFADTLPRIDLILMDIRLPYEDGFQALRKVRGSARLKDTPVVAVTAEASVEQMKRAKEAGFDGFLGKPLDPDRFPEQIRRVMRGESVWELG